ncbi:PREDICTED: solute carrier family 2, facilitated glucose transporter member 11-like isoform X2 [Nanorana parkeri]|uniref:solute carrier family 2, facilitated glucose transporter member 11-like isoform X2 n=1 Tax=Nanorana parkeri TaxID=125878 RepID=UPI000854C44D|nr:PREDICTED: solute carrier family 2, facilitated glucose transporter member 11-like isoform X2 [Nanorana parkeri]
MTSTSSELVHYRGLFLMVFVLGIGGTFQYGYHLSVLNSPSPFIKQFINDTWARRYKTQISDGTLTLIWSFVVSIFSIGGLIGSTASGYLTGRFGKKKCLLVNSILPIFSALLVGLNQVTGYFEMVLAGRFVSGLNAGLGINIHAQYLGETAPRKLRGFINATGPMFVTLGKLCGQIVGLRELFGTEFLWPQVLLLSGITSFVQLVSLPFFPEPPIYLLLEKDDKDACQKALKQLWGDRDHRAAIDEMLKEKTAGKKGRMGVLELLRDPSHRWQLFAMIGMILSLQLSGASAIYFYSYDVFHNAGFPEDRIAYVSLGVGSFEFVSAMICSLLIDRFGRKALILGGYSLMALTLALLTVTLSMQVTYFWMPYCSVGLTFTFIFLYGAGPAGATISTCVEIFAQAPRVPAFVVSGVFSWVGLYILGMVFPYIVESLQQFCFLLFIFVILLFGTLIFFIVPETKGKTIVEISQEFNKLNFRRQYKEDKPSMSPEDIQCTSL